ncbi:50S ribosomal protein L19 [Candidatus Dojkabacteria bacterium]|nr:50S ribosomal protein L19 [Candidatus Dojkabacteria bacterium]
MDTQLVDKVTSEYKKAKHPTFDVGDIIEVSAKIKEDGKERIQVFRGVVIAVKGSDTGKTVTVRKISYGVGVEKIFPIYSPMVAKIKVVKRAGKIKRSKLYFLRDRVGKLALKAGVQIPAEGEDLETEFEEKMEKEVEEKEEVVEEEKEKSKSDNKDEKGEERDKQKVEEEKKSQEKDKKEDSSK